MRIILDTNVLIAGLLPAQRQSANRAAAQCLERALAKGRLLISAETLGELALVLARPVFDPQMALCDRLRFLARIARGAQPIPEVSPVRLCRDPEDDKFFALAAAGMADWLVSLDKQVLAVRRLGPTLVVRPERFLVATA